MELGYSYTYPTISTVGGIGIFPPSGYLAWLNGGLASGSNQELHDKVTVTPLDPFKYVANNYVTFDNSGDYADTGILPTSTTVWEFIARFPTNSDSPAFMGSGRTADGDGFSIGRDTSEPGKWLFSFGDAYATLAADTSWHSWKFEALTTSMKVYQDDVLVATATPSGEPSFTENLILGARSIYDAIFQDFIDVDLAYSKITQGGSVVHELTCAEGGLSQYLYDISSNGNHVALQADGTSISDMRANTSDEVPAWNIKNGHNPGSRYTVKTAGNEGGVKSGITLANGTDFEVSVWAWIEAATQGLFGIQDYNGVSATSLLMMSVGSGPLDCRLYAGIGTDLIFGSCGSKGLHKMTMRLVGTTIYFLIDDVEKSSMDVAGHTFPLDESGIGGIWRTTANTWHPTLANTDYIYRCTVEVDGELVGDFYPVDGGMRNRITNEIKAATLNGTQTYLRDSFLPPQAFEFNESHGSGKTHNDCESKIIATDASLNTDSFWSDGLGTLEARTKDEILANNDDTDTTRSSYNDDLEVVEVLLYGTAPTGADLAKLNTFLDGRHS